MSSTSDVHRKYDEKGSSGNEEDPYLQARPLDYYSDDPFVAFPVARPAPPPIAPLYKTGGWQPVLVLVDSLVILGAASFSFYAQRHHIVFSQRTFAGRILNSSNVSALISGGGAVIVAVYVWGLALLGRMWLVRRVKRGVPIELGQLMAIASRGAIDEIQHAFRVAGILFVSTLAISWYIPAALSGALNPTLTKTSEDVIGKMTYYQMAGSGGNATLSVANDCFAVDTSCPAKRYYADHYQSLQFAYGYSAYFQSWGAYQNTTPIVPTQFGVSAAYGQVSKSRLADYSSVVSASACVPLTFPNVSCVIVVDEGSVRTNGGQISYDTPCGTTTLGSTTQAMGGSFTSMCDIEDQSGTTKLYHTVVKDSTAGSESNRQLQCDIVVQERFRQVEFWAADANWYNDTGPCLRDFNTLTHAESKPLISSVAYVLTGAAQQLDKTSGANRNPLYDLVDSAMDDGDLERLELMVANGIQTAASIIYGVAFGEANGTLTNPSTAYMDARVVFAAYTWGSGWKGYIWATLLALAAIVGLSIFGAAFFVPRLGYDPGSYAQTLFLDKASVGNDEADLTLRPLPPRHEKFLVSLHGSHVGSTS